MGRGHGPIQTALIERLESAWQEEPLVRIAAPGENPQLRRRFFDAVRRLEKRGFLVRVRMWGVDVKGRANPVTLAARPGTMIYSELLGKDIPVEQLALQFEGAKAQRDELAKVQRVIADQGVHLTNDEVAELVSNGALDLAEEIRLLQAEVNERLSCSR